jgi:glycosyltransferase involved in cell wall biosynthesis
MAVAHGRSRGVSRIYEVSERKTPVSLRILYVAYPLLAISEASCGGAEQVLLNLEREMSRRGHRTMVAAAEGSQVSGELYPTGRPVDSRDGFTSREEKHNRAIRQLVARQEFDLVHDMSGSFWRRASDVQLPILATLHLPTGLYAAGMFDALAFNLYFNCVSLAQSRAFAHLPRMLRVVENGIDLERFGEVSSSAAFARRERKGGPPAEERKGGESENSREFLLWMGRICEEKAPHIAIDVAADAGLPIAIAGQVYPFSYHERYFAREIEPRLQRYPQAKFVETPSFEEKIALLDHARALLITSQIDETSSLVAMEAMACGTPVVTFRRGALGEVVEHRVTGFVVETASEMAQALSNLHVIDPAACRARVERLYASTRMADDYLRLYDQVLRSYGAWQQRAA